MMARMHYIKLIIFISLVTSVSSIYIGRLQKARLLPGLKNQTAWLFNQTNANACLCNVINNYPLSNVAALNSFSQNQTCQIILSPPVLSPRIVFDNKSSLILFQPLTNAPCCSDLSWLLYTIQNSAQQFKASVTLPTTVSISSDNNYVSVMSYRSNKLIRLNRNNLTPNSTQSLPSGYNCSTAIYRNGYIFVGCDLPTSLLIYNETNLTTAVARINMTKYVRAVSFTRNDSLLFVPVQRSSYCLYIYNITWKPSISTSLVTQFTSTTSTEQTWVAHTINDTAVLLSTWDQDQAINIIRSPSATSSVWAKSTLNKTTVTGTNSLGEAVVDSCGRIWEIVYGFGIRIFDPSGTALLANWTLSTGLSNILLLDNYELFLSDYYNNLVYQYKPNIQCTS